MTKKPDENAADDHELRRRLCDDVLGGRERWHTESDRRRAKRYYFESTGKIEADESEIGGFLQWYTHDFRNAAAEVAQVSRRPGASAIGRQAAVSSQPPESARPIPAEMEREIVLQMKAAHYATWPDDPLPALGGKTARQAVKTKSSRQAVLELIRDMEHGEARGAKQGQPAFDFTALRKTLGLEGE
jgi:hypothetical protein